MHKYVFNLCSKRIAELFPTQELEAVVSASYLHSTSKEEKLSSDPSRLFCIKALLLKMFA